MQRTFNYTGRKKILQSEALFSFTGCDKNPAFNVEFRINEKHYPANASLYVEAYFKETKQRYNFGTVSKIKPPADLSLRQIDISGTTLFRVLIVDESNGSGILLGSGDKFRANKDVNEDQNKVSILAVKTKPLGQLPWRTDIDTGSTPELILNSGIPNIMHKIKTDPLYQALIFPAALKEVLTYFLINDDENEFAKKWMAFGKEFTETEIPNSEDIDSIKDYVDEIISEYSDRFNLSEKLVFLTEDE